MYPHSLIDLSELKANQLQEILSLANDIKADPKRYFGACEGKILATLFYEPSTRTQMSFQTAMLRLGGETIGFDNPMNSSVSKGESLADTIRIVSGYADILAMRHPFEGAAKAAALYTNCPIINAGDGGHLHPTQTLTDLVTIYGEKQTVSGLTIGMCGDLKNGRTVHSLVKTLCRNNNKFVFISTPELGLPQYLLTLLEASGCKCEFVTSLEEAIPQLDVLYMTRIQKERFASEKLYEEQKNVYVLDAKKMLRAKADLIVLHPLPRVDEITYEVDEDPRALYFKQAKCGVYARMALIMKMLEGGQGREKLEGTPGARCTNPNCITSIEKYLPSTYKKDENAAVETMLCEFCEH
ncbi:MAG: aspartate carbamoyltransferase [Oscillospiraceae bacterium]|nr:aspartate carbamoyltransferase [Oscillospiraceae bacterium]